MRCVSCGASDMATIVDRIDVSNSVVSCLPERRCGGQSGALSAEALGRCCVVICLQHRMPLVDTCPVCSRQAHPIFRWIADGPVLVCVQCDAMLHEGWSAQGAPISVCSSIETCSDDCLSAAIAGISWAQSMILRALQGHAIAGPRHYRLAAGAFIAFVESLVADLLYSLGVVRDASPASHYWANPGRYMLAGLPARDAFIVMAAIAAMLALPDTAARGRCRSTVWWRQLGAPVDLARLWTRSERRRRRISLRRVGSENGGRPYRGAVALTLPLDAALRGAKSPRRDRRVYGQPRTAKRAGRRSAPGRGAL